MIARILRSKDGIIPLHTTNRGTERQARLQTDLEEFCRDGENGGLISLILPADARDLLNVVDFMVPELQRRGSYREIYGFEPLTENSRLADGRSKPPDRRGSEGRPASTSRRKAAAWFVKRAPRSHVIAMHREPVRAMSGGRQKMLDASMCQGEPGKALASTAWTRSSS